MIPRIPLHVVALLLAASACSANGDGVDAVPADLPGFYDYAIGHESLTPVYQLVPEFRSEDDVYARSLLARECLKDVADYRVVPPSEDEASFMDDRTGQAEFDEEIASQWGYRAIPLSDQAAPADTNTGVDQSLMTPELLDRMKRCGEETDERLGLPPERVMTEIEEAGWTASATDSELVEVTTAWRSCVEPIGLADLPDSPSEMPSPSLRDPVETAGSGDVEADTVVAPPSRREIEVAVADARCRESVNYPQTLIDARARGEFEAIAARFEEFEAARATYPDYHDRIEAVIAELG